MRAGLQLVLDLSNAAQMRSRRDSNQARAGAARGCASGALPGIADAVASFM
jgi:hypothetical protein